MNGNSRPVTSPQTTPHEALETLVLRHAATVFRKPPAAYSRDAFALLETRLAGGLALVLDAGCGTGESTVALARRHPDCLVAGIDQSAHRLARAPGERPDNVVLLRANVVDLWLLLAGAGIRPVAQYLLYPNPWPKPAQVMRRWPAHPVFPTVLSLGGRIECRTNWAVYAHEFARAAELLGAREVVIETLEGDQSLTPFERKYRASGHALHRVVVDRGAAAVSR
jgi:tRNA (guanine-N7-)-methyltransferase